jgi:hypothetical protein
LLFVFWVPHLKVPKKAKGNMRPYYLRLPLESLKISFHEESDNLVCLLNDALQEKIEELGDFWQNKSPLYLLHRRQSIYFSKTHS